MYKRLTIKAQNAIKQLQKNTRQNDLKKIDALSLLRIISNYKGSLGKTLLDSFEIKIEKLAPTDSQKTSVHKAITKAARIAFSNKSSHIGTEHLVQSVLSMPEYSHATTTTKQSPDPHIKVVGIKPHNTKENDHHPQDPQDYFGEISSMIEHYFSPGGMTKQKRRSSLNTYCTNLNKETTAEHVVIGRAQELERISHILGRKMKNNPVLIGEPGVGKTAIIEGLAQNIQKETVPHYLDGKQILSLDLGSLIAGTTFRGEFEARLKEILSELKKNPEVILFIDEIHNLVGAGNAIGGMDAANLLKPVLSRGNIQVIGATTIDEYKKHIEKDAALERRFQPIFVDEPTISETTKILLGIKPLYEKYHNVTISDKACATSSSLAERYITDRFLPDSAIDLLDETAARKRSELSDKSLYHQINKARKKKKRLAKNKELLVTGDRYEEAIRIRHEEKKVSASLKKLEKQLRIFEKKNPIKIKGKDIRSTLSLTCQIPEELLQNQDRQLVKNVQSILKKKLLGQSHVNKKISNNILRQVSGISSPNKPLGSFLFIGPSGVGKTHAAKLLAKAISPNGTEKLIQLNMSEFMERHTASRLLGAPAGYVGYEEGGQLTDQIRRKPHCVVLFDEIEKAEPSVLNLLLQILEEGEISDSKGKKINFRNTIIILTSNIGTNDLDRVSELGFSSSSRKASQEKKRVDQAILAELDETLLPEFINRLDEILIFDSLDQKTIRSVITLEINDLQKRLQDKKVFFSISEKALDHLSKKAFAPKQGARGVRKILQDTLEPFLAKRILAKKRLGNINVDLQNGKLIEKRK